MNAPIDFAALMRPVAEALLGEPNARLSTVREWRYRTHGSLVVHVDGEYSGTFRDHEADAGGGVLDLVIRETGASDTARRWPGCAMPGSSANPAKSGERTETISGRLRTRGGPDRPRARSRAIPRAPLVESGTQPARWPAPSRNATCTLGESGTWP